MFDFRANNSYGGFGDERQQLFDRIRQKKVPPLTGETPPIIAQDGPMPEETRHSSAMMPGNHTAQAMPWKQRISGGLGAVSSLFGGNDGEEEQYLEPMPMQQQQGQIFAPQAPGLWAGQGMPKRPFRRF
jgi:hypothetical protein